ncbi:ATPase [Paenibacillus sp. N1-5-1-14]|uniref:N-acetylglucosamine kinase n=1 Tax=Paenibacillus radicibacter TaxID=2972488 RepID=UPI002159A936|nr:BadF/BadG/BcrA/BcrD ATPase family protein [Paenibacillus radicibacter]MCR8643639.1 ATPase [Paenibacillus radicibacter]
MSIYVAGLDGGGTKTAVKVMDASGKLVHAFTSGAINYNGQDEASVHASLEVIFNTIAEVCGGLEHCKQVCIGAAGVSNPTVSSRLTASVRACGYVGGLLITGDQETALCGAHEREYGLILIAGTGSICYGKNESGITCRAGGYGHLIDDEGSGYSIGRDLLSLLVRVNDGRMPASIVPQMIYEQLQMNAVQQIIQFVYDKGTNKKDIAALAPILSRACEAGDAAALAIADQCAQSLLELVIPVAKKLELQEGSLGMAGSVLLHNMHVQQAFIEKLKFIFPKMSCLPAEHDAATGAGLMALNRL